MRTNYYRLLAAASLLVTNHLVLGTGMNWNHQTNVLPSTATIPIPILSPTQDVILDLARRDPFTDWTKIEPRAGTTSDPNASPTATSTSDDGSGSSGNGSSSGSTDGSGSSGNGSSSGSTDGQGPPPGTTIDPADAGFLGGSPPNRTVDLPVTIVFLLIYLSMAFTHISIYQANAKRGHKFLLSDLMFDFCMVRTVTCIFRIIWIFIQPRGVILSAQLFFNGGAAVIFAVNVFLVQRIIRSMHPRLGWSKGFSLATRFLAISVPVNIVLQIGSLIGLFFSVGNETRLDAFESILKFGSSWNLFLVTFPFIAISIACAVPGPRPEKFGAGNLRVKTSLVLFASAALATGASIRSYATFNPRAPNTTDVLYSKPVFYTTQFMLEVIVVVLYALLRFDLLFHIPNGSKGPGDYSRNQTSDPEKVPILTRRDIEERIAVCGIPYRIMETSYSKNSTIGRRSEQPVFALFFPTDFSRTSEGKEIDEVMKEGTAVQSRSMRKRVSRRQSVINILDRQRQSIIQVMDRRREERDERKSRWGYGHLKKGEGGAVPGKDLETMSELSGLSGLSGSSGTQRSESSTASLQKDGGSARRDRTPPPGYPSEAKVSSGSRRERGREYSSSPSAAQQQQQQQQQYQPREQPRRKPAPAPPRGSPSRGAAPVQQNSSPSRSRSRQRSPPPPPRSPPPPPRTPPPPRERDSVESQQRRGREKVPSVSQLRASGSSGTAPPARPHRDLQSMYHAGEDARPVVPVPPPTQGHKGKH